MKTPWLEKWPTQPLGHEDGKKKHPKFFKSLRSGIGARFSSHFPILFEKSEDHWDHDQLQAMASKSKRLGSFFLADLAVANSWEQTKNHGI